MMHPTSSAADHTVMLATLTLLSEVAVSWHFEQEVVVDLMVEVVAVVGDVSN